MLSIMGYYSYTEYFRDQIKAEREKKLQEIAQKGTADLNSFISVLNEKQNKKI